MDPEDDIRPEGKPKYEDPGPWISPSAGDRDAFVLNLTREGRAAFLMAAGLLLVLVVAIALFTGGDKDRRERDLAATSSDLPELASPPVEVAAFQAREESLGGAAPPEPPPESPAKAGPSPEPALAAAPAPERKPDASAPPAAVASTTPSPRPAPAPAVAKTPATPPRGGAAPPIASPGPHRPSVPPAPPVVKKPSTPGTPRPARPTPAPAPPAPPESRAVRPAAGKASTVEKPVLAAQPFPAPEPPAEPQPPPVAAAPVLPAPARPVEKPAVVAARPLPPVRALPAAAAPPRSPLSLPEPETRISPQMPPAASAVPLPGPPSPGEAAAALLVPRDLLDEYRDENDFTQLARHRWGMDPSGRPRVTRERAGDIARWFTARERAAGRLRAGDYYRLPREGESPWRSVWHESDRDDPDAYLPVYREVCLVLDSAA